MKKILLFCLLSQFATLSSQTLKFDVMTTYSIQKDNKVVESSACGISSNQNYILKIVNVNDGGQIARVYDLKNLKVYEFEMEDVNSEDGTNKHKFTYINSRSLNRSPIGKICFDFQYISTENEVETVKLIFYKNRSKTKKSSSLKLQILKSEIDLFHLFRFSCVHPLEFIREINYVNPGLVTNCTSENGLANYTLKAFEEINLEITLPK